MTAHFGKDFGLVKEAIATGYWAGAGRHFWDALSSPQLCMEVSSWLPTLRRDLNEAHRLLTDQATFFPAVDRNDPSGALDFDTVCTAIQAGAARGIGAEEWKLLTERVEVFAALLRLLYCTSSYPRTLSVQYSREPAFHRCSNPDAELLTSERSGFWRVKAALFPVTTKHSTIRAVERQIMAPRGFVSADVYELAAFAEATASSACPWALISSGRVIATAAMKVDGDTLYFACIDPYQGLNKLCLSLALGAPDAIRARHAELFPGREFILGVKRI